ncbi:unnamed protein product [Hymenolepis diminuta]|uniref:PhoLip_ATPase_N domain-containing protein n=1 Tax=Hymenolepis diminuta TaxID=6216 RepID=A0A0R3SJ54_HYMDI|nr:unnamed protein product [Hymenolepis diminuta]
MSNFEDPNKKFANNYVKTTKYKFWNFLFLNLWEQLHRFANCYFIFIVVLNFMPRIEAFGKELAVIPVAIVLGLTAVKDGFEDFKRFRADQVVNNMTANVFCVETRQYVKRKWAEIRPGDFVKLSTNEVIPADILLLKSSEISSMCHIETANLDGESNLKQRECVHSPEIQAFTPENFLWPVEVESPNPLLDRFSGKM